MSLEVIEQGEADVEELRALIQKAVRTRERTMGMIGVTLRRMVRAGRKLVDTKGEKGHGVFMAWLASEKLTGEDADQVSYATLARWMVLARFELKNPGALDTCSSITAAYRLAGLLPDAESNGSGNGSGGGGGLLAVVAKAQQRLEQEIAAKPLPEWSRQDLKLLETRLRNFAELHEKVAQRLLE